MTDETLLKLIPPIGGGMSAKTLAKKLLEHEGSVNLSELAERLKALAGRHQLKRIGVYYWGVR